MAPFVPSPSAKIPGDRRSSPRRRARDRIASLDRKPNPTLTRRGLANLALLVDDDLRQSAIALGRMEHLLARVAALLEEPAIDAGAVAELSAALAPDGDSIPLADELADSLVTLCNRMQQLAASLK